VGKALRTQNNWWSGLEQRSIADIWLALKTTAFVFGQITVVGGAVVFFGMGAFTKTFDPTILVESIFIIWLLSFWFILRVWWTYHEGIVIDAGRSELSFPASDVENSIKDIIMLKRFFNHGRRETLRLSSIQTVMNETRARRGHYAVNIAGNFGSRQFSFDSKQKRDEFRDAIDWAARKTGVILRQDRNSDVGGYGA
jgi:hypothetical protein